MGVPAERHRYTVEEYLRMEEASVDKHEYHEGEVLAMSGGTYDHSIVIANLLATVHAPLRGTPCRVAESNLRVRTGTARRYLYPDATIVCGKPEFDTLDTKRTTILNPRVVFEVLSESTEAYDRGEKFGHYRDIPTLGSYVLVSPWRPAVEVFSRQPDGSWRFESFAGLDAIARLPSVGIEVPLRELYDGVAFAPDDEEGPEADRLPAPDGPSSNP